MLKLCPHFEKKYSYSFVNYINEKKLHKQNRIKIKYCRMLTFLSALNNAIVVPFKVNSNIKIFNWPFYFTPTRLL